MLELVLPLQELLVFFKARIVLYTCSQRLLVSDATQIPSSEIEGITPIINQLLSGTKVIFYHLWLGLQYQSMNTALPGLGADLCFSCLILLSLFSLSVNLWLFECWVLQSCYYRSPSPSSDGYRKGQYFLLKEKAHWSQ